MPEISGSPGMVRPVTTFIGRRSELIQLAALLPSSRLVTLVGTAGAGKTRLALEAAGRSVGPDEVLAVAELAPLGGPERVGMTIAASFGVVATAVTAMDSLAAWLRDRAALLVLDNCEHVRDESAS